LGKKPVIDKYIDPGLTISDKSIKRVSEIKLLGVIIDENITFNQHCGKLSSYATRHLVKFSL